jgi:uncharacterized protein YcbK (DUF882 family)
MHATQSVVRPVWPRTRAEPEDFSRRRWLRAAAGGACALGLVPDAVRATTNVAQVFTPGDASSARTPETSAPPRLGHIPADFWLRPRTLWLYRNETREHLRATYFADGRLQPEAYWKVCALLRDVRANVMTAIDPGLLDVLRGIAGYYEAWQWNYPLVVNSGYRTEATNRTLWREGAARNSLHLSGRAADVWMPGIPVRDVGALGLHFRRGGVGFYVDKGFVHLDTGRLRSWRAG